MKRKFAFAVMAHPSRTAMAEEVRSQLSEAGTCTIGFDPLPEADPSPLRTAKIAWRSALNSTAELIGVVQDDVVVSARLAKTISKIAPDEGTILKLFTKWSTRSAQLNRMAVLHGASRSPCFSDDVHAVGVLFARADAEDFLSYMESLPDGATKDSVAMRDFVAAKALRVDVAAPCLLEHDVLSAPSIVFGSIQPPRRAATFTEEIAFTSSDILIPPNEFPFISADDGRSYVARTDGVEPKMETLVQRYIARNVSRGLLQHDFGMFLAREGAQYAYSTKIANMLLFQVWLCCCALSTLIPDVSDIRRVEAGLATILPAAVHRFVDIRSMQGELDALSRLLVGVVVEPPSWADDWATAPP